jgi:hypothetical protein
MVSCYGGHKPLKLNSQQPIDMVLLLLSLACWKNACVFTVRRFGRQDTIFYRYWSVPCGNSKKEYTSAGRRRTQTESLYLAVKDQMTVLPYLSNTYISRAREPCVWMYRHIYSADSLHNNHFQNMINSEALVLLDF